MTRFLKTTLAASALALMAGAASAAHVEYSGNLAGFQTAGGDDMIPLSMGPFDFNATFIADDADDVGGMFEFNFTNDYTSSVALTVADITINQINSTAGFTGGVVTTFGTNTRTSAQGSADGFTFTSMVGVGESITLTFDYGDAYGTPGFMDSFVGPDIDFLIEVTPTAVPVPAAGFMLLAGLGGLAAARRKKLV